MSPRVSVLTATYNQERFARRCMDSVRDQTYRDLEHIVVDDGSSDSTPRLLESRDGIVYRRQENAGNVASRNAALQMSSGDLIAVLDGDDWWDPQKLQRQVEIMDADPRVGLVYTGIVEVDERSRPLRAVVADDITQDPIAAQLRSNATPFSSMLIRRSALGDELIDPRFNLVGDRYLTLQVALDGWTFGCVREPLLYLRQHSSSMRYTAEFREEYLRQMLTLLDDVGGDARLTARHARELPHARGAALFTAAWLMVDRGGPGERADAARYLLKAVRQSPALFPRIVRQFAKMGLRSARLLRRRDRAI